MEEQEAKVREFEAKHLGGSAQPNGVVMFKSFLACRAS